MFDLLFTKMLVCSLTHKNRDTHENTTKRAPFPMITHWYDVIVLAHQFAIHTIKHTDNMCLCSVYVIVVKFISVFFFLRQNLQY